MENRLDFIEQLLKRFFEQLGHSESQRMHFLITHIITQMTLNATPQKDGISILPEIIRVNISQYDEGSIPEIKEIIHLSMPDILNQLARDQYIIRNEPLVTIHTSDDLEKGEIKVIALSNEDGIEDTSVLPVFSAFERKETVPIRSYLLFPDGEEYPLEGVTINIGRNPENHLVLDFPIVSRHHAQIRLINGVHHIFDIQSTAGTYINDVQIEHGILNSGDVIRIADQKLIYVSEVSQPNQGDAPNDLDTQEIL
jgi:hypothetical protein